MLFLDTFKDKTVLITGQTGFKGSWLSLWLTNLGANVIGVGLKPNSDNSFYSVNNLNSKIDSRIFDIRDKERLNNLIKKANPDFIFHLAAQALVRRSYLDPLETWSTNLMGTLHILESLRSLKKKCVCILITSDKCYKNKEWLWGYRETDILGGSDPYSASKASAELAIKSYYDSFLKKELSQVRIASVRAGNVIGGGDWSEDRIVPDCIRAWSKGELVKLRSPNATRPWQHVLEPLSGYLSLASSLYKENELDGEVFNFGPSLIENHSVLDLVKSMSTYWKKVMWEDISNNSERLYESGLLKLNCDKALAKLKWQSTLSFEETIRFTVEWYREFYESYENISNKSLNQIEEYISFAKTKSLSWAK